MSIGRRRSGGGSGWHGYPYPPAPIGYPSGPPPGLNDTSEVANGAQDESATRVVCLTLAPVAHPAKAAANSTSEDILRRAVHRVDPATGETVSTAEWLRECVEESLDWVIKLLRRHESFWDATNQTWITTSDDNNTIWLTFGAGYELVVLLGDAPVPTSLSELQTMPKLGVTLAYVDTSEGAGEEDNPLDELQLQKEPLMYPKDAFWDHVDYDYHKQKEEGGGEHCHYSVYSTNKIRGCYNQATKARIFRIKIDPDNQFAAGSVTFCGTLDQQTTTITNANGSSLPKSKANKPKTSKAKKPPNTTNETAEVAGVAVIPGQKSKGKVALAARLAAGKEGEESEKSNAETNEKEPSQKKGERKPKATNGDDTSKSPKDAATKKRAKEKGSKVMEVSTADKISPVAAKPAAKKRGRPPKAAADKKEETTTEQKPKKKRKMKKLESDSDKPAMEDKEVSSPKKKKAEPAKKDPKHDDNEDSKKKAKSAKKAPNHDDNEDGEDSKKDPNHDDNDDNEDSNIPRRKFMTGGSTSGSWTFMGLYPKEVNALANAFNGVKKRSSEMFDYSEYFERDLQRAEKTAVSLFEDLD